MIEIRAIEADEAEALAAALAARLRPGDLAECQATGLSPEEVILRSVRGSFCAWAAWDGDRPLAAWGAQAPMLFGGVAYPWLLTGPEVVNHKRLFLRLNRSFVVRLTQTHPRLEVFVLASYDTAVRWLRWLGFSIGETIPIGPDGTLFRRATIGG